MIDAAKFRLRRLKPSAPEHIVGKIGRITRKIIAYPPIRGVGASGRIASAVVKGSRRRKILPCNNNYQSERERESARRQGEAIIVIAAGGRFAALTDY